MLWLGVLEIWKQVDSSLVEAVGSVRTIAALLSS